MGTCASTQNSNPLSGNQPVLAVSNVIKVVNMEGLVKEFNIPICVEQILCHYPGCFLSNLDSLVIDACPTHVPEHEELKPGQLYFVLPKSLEQKPLSLENLCELAIKSSYNLSVVDL